MKAIECPKCGKMNDGTTDFCIYCGTIYEEYNAEEDDSNFFFIGRNPKNKGNIFNPMQGNNSQGNKSYTLLIIIGYIFAILGSVLGFIFAFYLITRKDPNAKRHGIIQLVLLVLEFILVGVLIYTGQMDPNIILNPFNSTNMANMTQMYNSSSMNMSGSSNLSSLFGF